jgi:4-hydroxybenzoate polyprenyltransferase
MVLGLFSQRLLTLFQLTRMALVFTAISNSLAEAMLLAARQAAGGAGGGHWSHCVSVSYLLAVAVMSAGLYGFGMSLNDIIDRRRDMQTAADRPLPSGRIGLTSAYVICALLAGTALSAGICVQMHSSADAAALALLGWTMLLVVFYDFAGKYLVAPGLLTLGLIRFFHAIIPAPDIPLLWHPLLLLNHVTLLSAVAYRWECKRPELTRRQGMGLIGGLVLADVAVLLTVGLHRRAQGASWAVALALRPVLLLPAAAMVGFVILAWIIRRTALAEASGDRRAAERRAGKNLMLYGLLWLIVYDALFVGAYVSIPAAGILLCLLPIAWLAVRVMRAWARVVALSQRPEYLRAR